MAFKWLQHLFTPSVLCPSTFFLIALVLILKSKSGKRKPNLPPSPLKLPVIGNLQQLRSMPHLALHRMARKLGPIIYLQLGEVPTVVVSSARLAKEVMKTHDLALASRPQLYSAKHMFYNCTDIAFFPYNAYWRFVRKLCILELLSARQVQLYSFIRQEEAARLVSRIAASYPNLTNLSKMLALYANDVIFRAAFGRDFSQGGENDQHGFQEMLDEYQERLGGFSIGDFFPSMEFIHSLTGLKSRLQNVFRRFDQFFDEIIVEHLNPARQKETHKDLVDILLHL